MIKEFYWKKALEVTEKAIKQECLIPIKTKQFHITYEINKDFELRELIGTFPKQIKNTNKRINPFLPFDKKLYIDSINNTHNLILNKFPVQKGHMLLITKKWSPQDGWLDLDDFQSINTIEHDTNGLWFFNSSKNAGASQPHRHIQFLPRDQREKTCPRDEWFKDLICKKDVSNLLSKSIAVKIRNDRTKFNYKELYLDYLTLAKEKGLGTPDNDLKPKCDHNIIITKDWIALIRRSCEGNFKFEINALGFAGYFLSTSKEATNLFLNKGGEFILESVVAPY